MRRGRTPNQYVSKQRHSFRVELVVEFEDTTSVQDATEAARRMLESVQISGDKDLPSVTRCAMLCHDTRQSIVLLPNGNSAG